jgi:hypothetical protein
MGKCIGEMDPTIKDNGKKEYNVVKGNYMYPVKV